MINFKSAMKEGIQKKNVLQIVLTLLGIRDIHYHLGGYIRIKKNQPALPYFTDSSLGKYFCALYFMWDDLQLLCTCELAQATFSCRQADLHCHVNSQS